MLSETYLPLRRLALVALLTAATPLTIVAAPQSDSAADEARLREWARALAEGDDARLASFYAPDAQLYRAVFPPTPIVGAEAIAGWFLIEERPVEVVDVARLEIADRWGFVELWFTRRVAFDPTRPLGDIRAFRFRLRRGLFTEQHGYRIMRAGFRDSVGSSLFSCPDNKTIVIDGAKEPCVDEWEDLQLAFSGPIGDAQIAAARRFAAALAVSDWAAMCGVVTPGIRYLPRLSVAARSTVDDWIAALERTEYRLAELHEVIAGDDRVYLTGSDDHVSSNSTKGKQAMLVLGFEGDRISAVIGYETINEEGVAVILR